MALQPPPPDLCLGSFFAAALWLFSHPGQACSAASTAGWNVFFLNASRLLADMGSVCCSCAVVLISLQCGSMLAKCKVITTKEACRSLHLHNAWCAQCTHYPAAGMWRQPGCSSQQLTGQQDSRMAQSQRRTVCYSISHRRHRHAPLERLEGVPLLRGKLFHNNHCDRAQLMGMVGEQEQCVPVMWCTVCTHCCACLLVRIEGDSVPTCGPPLTRNRVAKE